MCVQQIYVTHMGIPLNSGWGMNVINTIQDPLKITKCDIFLRNSGEHTGKNLAVTILYLSLHI